MVKKNVHIGSSFDSFLAEDGRLAEANAIAIKRVITWQFEQAMNTAGITKSDMAARMQTSRASLNRLLDENDTGLTLDTLSRGAQALGYRVKVELVA